MLAQLLVGVPPHARRLWSEGRGHAGIAAEALSALRAWDPGGLEAWVLAAEERPRLPLSQQECRGLAQAVDALELSPPEFERLIALSGFRERRVSKVFWFQIERIVQIVSIRRSRLLWLLKD